MRRSRGSMPICWHDETNERTVYLTCEFDYSGGQVGVFTNYPETSVEPLSSSAVWHRFICDKIVRHGEHGDNEYEPACGSIDADDAIVSYLANYTDEHINSACAGYWAERLEEAVCQGA